MRKKVLLDLKTEYPENIDFRKAYFDLIKESKSKLVEGYTEKHHILPVSLFPLWKKRKTNLVELSLEDHYRAHYLLYKIYNNFEMTSAFLFMLKTTKGKYNPTLFSELRNKYITYLNKKVYCYELDKTFDSITIAAKEIKKVMSGLATICRLKKFDKTVGGYHWCLLINRDEAIKFWENNLIYKNKPVYCYELDKTFNSIVETKTFLNKLKQGSTHVSEACRTKNFIKTVGGCHWCFVNDKDEAIEFWKNNLLKNGKNKPVYCYELDRIFISSNEAIDYLKKCHRSDITNICKNKKYNKTVAKHHFCYIQDKDEAIEFWKKLTKK